MEARTILLTSLLFAMWTSSTTLDETYCVGKDDGPYCMHCLQPVTCTGEEPTVYTPCGEGQACILDFGFAFCTPHTDTVCACAGAGDQCDAYNPGYIERCDASGPFLVDECPEDAPTCYNDECAVYPDCIRNEWDLTPDCTSIFFCDSEGFMHPGVDCADGEYVNSEYECAPAPPPACDGSCSGPCPNPVDCTKFFICDGTTVVGSGGCAEGSFFDIDVNDCINGEHTCHLLDGCDFDVGFGPEITTTSREITTTSDKTPTTTDETTTTTTEVITTTSDVITTTSKEVTTTSDVITTTSDAITTTSDVITTTSDVITTTSDVITTTSDLIITTSDLITTTSDVITTSDLIITTSDVITSTIDVITTSSHVITCCSDSRTTIAGIATTTDGWIFTVPPDEICDSSTLLNKYPTATCSKQYWVCAEMPNGQYNYIVDTCLGDWYFNTNSNLPYCNIPACL